MELVESLQGKPALVFYNFQHDKERVLKALAKTGLRVRELKTTQDEDDWNNREIDILLTPPGKQCLWVEPAARRKPCNLVRSHLELRTVYPGK